MAYVLTVASPNVAEITTPTTTTNQAGGQRASPLSLHFSSRELLVKFLRRYWGAGLIVVMVAIHAAVIGYVRSRVNRISSMASTAVEIGSFRFQPVADLSRVYQFKVHAVVDPSKRRRGEERLAQKRLEILEAAEQMLRLVDPVLLDDPSQTQIRDSLMDIVLRHLDEPLVQRVLITNWLKLPVNAIDLEPNVSRPNVAYR